PQPRDGEAECRERPLLDDDETEPADLALRLAGEIGDHQFIAHIVVIGATPGGVVGAAGGASVVAALAVVVLVPAAAGARGRAAAIALPLAATAAVIAAT